MARSIQTAALPEWSELDDISVELKQYLNIPNLRPYLRHKHVLTEAELEKVQISSANPRDQAIDTFVSILKTKGPEHSKVFLKVLRLSLKDEDSHMGHVYLCEKLEKLILERQTVTDDDVSQLREVVGQIPIPRPAAHRPCHRNDSGIEFQSVTSSGGSSQDTSYVRNLFSSVGSNLYDDAYDHGHGQSRLTNHGLENFENEPAHRHGLDERQVSILKHKITNDFMNITSHFAVMVVGVYRLLKQNNAPVDEVRLMLQFLGCRTTAAKNEKVTLFSNSGELSESRDLESLISCLQKYSSWYNYRLMKLVAEQFTGEEGKKLISDYEAHLRKHYVTLIAYQCPEFSLDREAPHSYARLVVKVDWNYFSTNLQDITTFQSSLADILELEPYVFQLRSVEEGCVRFEWSLPAGLEPHVSHIMVVKEECLRQNRVLSLEIMPASETAAIKMVIEKHLHPPKDHLICQPMPSRKATLSATSSIVSVLDVPMSSMEAEILSLYDSSTASSIDGDSLSVQRYSSISKDDENGAVISMATHYQDNHQIDRHLNHHNDNHHHINDRHDNRHRSNFYLTLSISTSSAQVAKSAANTPVTTPTMTRRYHSEANLLSLSQPAAVKYATKRDGRSMVDIFGDDMATTPNKSERQNSVISSLKKLPKTIFKHLKLSQPRWRSRPEEVLEYGGLLSPTLLPQPFPLLELTQEPRKVGTIETKMANQIMSSDEGVAMDKNRNTDLTISCEVAMVSSPQGSDSPNIDKHNLESKRVSCDSGVASTSSFNSTYSNSMRYQRQTSNDSSEETASIVSVSTQPSSKRNSLNSHHTINPIYENIVYPYPGATMQLDSASPTMQANAVDLEPPSRDSASSPQCFPPDSIDKKRRLSTSLPTRKRSHSHDDGFYNRIPMQVCKIPSSGQSSGYASFAGSIVQVDTLVAMPSQDSLIADNDDDRKPSTESEFPQHVSNPNQSNAGAFPLRPHYHKSVRRGGSLNATLKFRTNN